MRRLNLKLTVKKALDEWCRGFDTWWVSLLSHRDKIKIDGIKSSKEVESLNDDNLLSKDWSGYRYFKINFENTPIVVMKFTEQNIHWQSLFAIKDGEKFYGFVWDKDKIVERIITRKSELIDALKDDFKAHFRDDILAFNICKSLTLPIVPSKDVKPVNDIKMYDGEQIENLINIWLLIHIIGAESGKVTLLMIP